VLTGLFAFMMLGSAIPDVVSSQMAIEGFKQINMPGIFAAVFRHCKNSWCDSHFNFGLPPH